MTLRIGTTAAGEPFSLPIDALTAVKWSQSNKAPQRRANALGLGNETLEVPMQINATCSVTDCSKPALIRGFCRPHYQRQRKHGTTDSLLPGFEARFWLKVDKDGPLPVARPDLGPCWIWTAGARHGYGSFSVGTRTRQQFKQAHRVAYELEFGPIPDGFTLDHLCKVTLCVRPTHLEPVTMAENLARSDGVANRHRAVTHCPRGHEYTEANTRREPNGRRHCRTCQTIQNAVRRNGLVTESGGVIVASDVLFS